MPSPTLNPFLNLVSQPQITYPLLWLTVLAFFEELTCPTVSGKTTKIPHFHVFNYLL